jgi:prevent-host-death family protein
MKREIAAGEFKAKCLRLLDDVARTRKDILITKRGRPVARLVPAGEIQAPLFGRMKGTIRICGDIVSPTGERWEADE